MQGNGPSCIRLPADVDGVDFDFKGIFVSSQI